MAKNENGANRRTALLVAAYALSGTVTGTRPGRVIAHAETYLAWLNDTEDDAGANT